MQIYFFFRKIVQHSKKDVSLRSLKAKNIYKLKDLKK